MRWCTEERPFGVIHDGSIASLGLRATGVYELEDTFFNVVLGALL